MVQRVRRWVGAFVMATALVSAGAARASNDAERFWLEADDRGQAGARPDSFASLAKTLSPAVVNLRVTRDSFGDRVPHEVPPASASGFVISADGYIVTNFHVVESATSVKVGFLDGREMPARVIGRDREVDLALVKVDPPSPLQVAPLGDSDAAQVGDWVIAIGNPLGLEHSVTVGIVSAKGRRVNGKYDDYLQTDASINPGNSGGPLIDTRGRVVGINTMIRVYESSATGIAFAIPVNMIKPLLPQLRASGKVTRGYLGIQFQPLTDGLARGFGLASTEGALVGDVLPDTPAARAQIESGDVIVEFAGQKILTAQDLPRSVASVPPGTKVPVIVLRSGKRQGLDVTIDAVPVSPLTAEGEPQTDPLPEAPQDLPAGPAFGFKVEPSEVSASEASSKAGSSFGFGTKSRLLRVTEVDTSGPAARSGLQVGDIVLEVNGKGVESTSQMLKALESEAFPVIRVLRGSNTVYFALEKSAH
jgi:serine protease Do